MARTDGRAARRRGSRRPQAFRISNGARRTEPRRPAGRDLRAPGTERVGQDDLHPDPGRPPAPRRRRRAAFRRHAAGGGLRRRGRLHDPGGGALRGAVGPGEPRVLRRPRGRHRHRGADRGCPPTGRPPGPPALDREHAVRRHAATGLAGRDAPPPAPAPPPGRADGRRRPGAPEGVLGALPRARGERGHDPRLEPRDGRGLAVRPARAHSRRPRPRRGQRDRARRARGHDRPRGRVPGAVGGAGVNPRRAGAVARRIVLQFRRDHRSLGLLFVAPMVVLTLVGALWGGSATSTVRIVAAGDVDPQLFEALRGTEIELTALDRDAALDALKTGKADAMIEFADNKATVTVEGSDPTRTGAILGHVQAALTHLILDVPLTAFVKINYLYGGPDYTLLDYLAPVLIAVFAFFFIFLLSTVSFLRERTSGTLERLLASPLTPAEMVVG